MAISAAGAITPFGVGRGSPVASGKTMETGGGRVRVLAAVAGRDRRDAAHRTSDETVMQSDRGLLRH